MTATDSLPFGPCRTCHNLIYLPGRGMGAPLRRHWKPTEVGYKCQFADRRRPLDQPRHCLGYWPFDSHRPLPPLPEAHK